MREEDEALLHNSLHSVAGTFQCKTNCGEMKITFEPIPNYAGGKGCPDEIVSLTVQLSILGADIELKVPILIELEKAGSNAAEVDLTKFCQRSISGEQNSYLKIPMVVIGGSTAKYVGTKDLQLNASFQTQQIPRRVVL